MSAAVRAAGSSDLPALVGLRRSWAEEQSGVVEDPGFDEAFRAWAGSAAGDRLFWLATVDDRAVGMANVAVFSRMPKPGRPLSRWGYLANVYVKAGHRDRGIGGLLLAAVLAEARTRGFARLVLSPSDRSVALYERAGFVPATSLMVLDLEAAPVRD